MVKNEIDSGHVFYFEPNDISIGQDQEGEAVALMPHLEDLCIAMTLTADVFPRDKECIYALDEENKNKIVQRSISWISYVNGGDIDISKQIVNQGVKMGDENYLTTYYTEISADKYIDNEIIEGLGVTGVNIAFESWYTPTITINFVDVHGSSLWGREEAIHDNGEITSDNILGVFFTQPYPLFRLQIKGFLGHDVTYQLSVSSFKGKYNSQTGNFEATATFIGYSYSLLTDIPLKLLSIVSEMTYKGKEYWDAHANSAEWAMINADGTRTPPVKLYKLIEDIKSAIGSLESKDGKNCDGTPNGSGTISGETEKKDPVSENRVVSNEAASQVTSAIDIKNNLGLVNTALEDFIKQCKSFAKDERGGGFIISPDDDLFMLITANSDGTVKPKDGMRTTYQTLCKTIEEYNKKHPNDKIVNDIEQNTQFHNDALNASKDNLVLKAEKFIKIYTQYNFETNNSSKVNFAVVKQPDNSPLGSIASALQTSQNVKTETQKKVREDFMKFVEIICATKQCEYAVVISLHTLRSQIANLYKRIGAVGENIETKIENIIAKESNSSELIEMKDKLKNDEEIEVTRKRKINEILGFEPTIGNFVKMLMCHLETFVEVMMYCGDTIYGDLPKRLPKNYNLDLGDDTDISNNNKEPQSTKDAPNKPIWPWPALYNPSPKNNSETSVSSTAKYETLGWTNDYPPKNEGVDWEEQKLVLSCLTAMERYAEETKIRAKGNVNVFTSLPMSGSDAFTTSPFSKVSESCKDIEHLSPYLGLRIANAIGVADNECTSDVAEAIGYMDALNLIASNSNYKNLKNAITSKENNQDFVEQVVDYLTCKNSIRQTSETEQGNKYNLFETILPNSGNHYSDTRHPMYIIENDKYKYSYVYSNTKEKDGVISLVPTELMEFTGKNQPYSSLFVPTYSTKNGKKILEYKPTITPSKNGSSNQNFVYTSKTKNLIEDDKLNDFANSQLFFVNTDIEENNTLLKRLQSIKEGDSKFKDYCVKGEVDDAKVKLFMDRRYKISLEDYYSIYNFNKNYRILMPALSRVDNKYYSEHLCVSTEKKNNIEYDTQWSNDTNSQLYIKTNVRVKEPGVSFKCGDSEYAINNVLIGELPIFINSKVKGSLFSSQIYYQQNDIKDEKLRDKAKAYLILSSMMSGVEEIEKDLFKNDTQSIIKLIPPFYVYFIGALLWRRSQDKEPLSLGEYANSSPDTNTSFISKEDKIFYVDTNDKKEWYNIEDYYMKYEDIDVVVKNKLISLFENFVNSRDFALIRDNSELKQNDNTAINSESWKELRSLWSYNTFNGKNAGQWSQIFGNMYDKYSSITFPSSTKSILRLLYNENNKAMNALKTLYGLNGGLIIGRGTTKRVGLGDNEVTVTKEQMKGYLKGFFERINDVKDTSDKTVQTEIGISASEVDRDYAIAFYYSLKHLWDTWLITSARDQFTIKNFFKKNFVFMDSFYMNTYNDIKLNAEFILDAYNTENANLLTFISNITSKEGCMLFALPSFLDSNISDGKDMAWKKENLKKLFTPMTFNEMGPPQSENIFVFIYTHPFADNALEQTDKKFDSYMITDQNHWPGVLKGNAITGATSDKLLDENDRDLKLHPNNSKPDDMDDLISSRYGYVMPCFGVTVNRGNNYIFKSINVNMDSPKITAVSAQTWENILTKTGADGSKRIFFHGQDIYSIYSQYAYSCEIEMIGCAQIQPLMYFQLLNIPMWRGTYMIYKVTHSMSPGTMTTKFTGMKMSRKQAPYATGYFTVVKKNAQTPMSTDLDDKSNTTDVIQVTDNNEEEIVYTTNKSGGGYPVGGPDMVKNIFGDYKGYDPSWKSYDVYRGVIKKKDKNGNVISQRKHWHCGIDIFGKEGTPLYAPWDGYVKIAKTNAGTAGNYLMFVDDTNKVGVVYMHCQKLNVKVGDKVKAGHILSWLGKTGGNAVRGMGTSPHLHLELYANGNFTMGEKKTHGGKGGHVDPSKSYGSI